MVVLTLRAWQGERKMISQLSQNLPSKAFSEGSGEDVHRIQR